MMSSLEAPTSASSPPIHRDYVIRIVINAYSILVPSLNSTICIFWYAQCTILKYCIHLSQGGMLVARQPPNNCVASVYSALIVIETCMSIQQAPTKNPTLCKTKNKLMKLKEIKSYMIVLKIIHPWIEGIIKAVEQVRFDQSLFQIFTSSTILGSIGN